MKLTLEATSERETVQLQSKLAWLEKRLIELQQIKQYIADKGYFSRIDIKAAQDIGIMAIVPQTDTLYPSEVHAIKN